jgi:hypothetical protein
LRCLTLLAAALRYPSHTRLKKLDGAKLCEQAHSRTNVVLRVRRQFSPLCVGLYDRPTNLTLASDQPIQPERPCSGRRWFASLIPHTCPFYFSPASAFAAWGFSFGQPKKGEPFPTSSFTCVFSENKLIQLRLGVTLPSQNDDMFMM